MDTGKLKKFAQQARRQLLTQVESKLKGVLAEGSLARRESSKAVQTLEQEIAESSRTQVVERVAYTWFNRFCALRFMDANRYTRVGIVSPAEGFLQPEILMDAKQGVFDDEWRIDRERALDLLNGSVPSTDPQREAYQLLLVAACNYYHSVMPFMFERIADYTELLIPDDLLSDNSVLTHTRNTLATETCQDVEVIGWLYQFYISEKKDEVFDGLKKGKKITPENIPAATQLFTPHWIVRYLVENSLGRLWMLNHPSSKLIEYMDYYIRPEETETDFLKISSPEEIKLCDPACGSGHMLTYAFDLLYAIYEEQGFQATDIPRLILKNNLNGVEIDQRAGALAAFALTMKAREKYRRFLQPDKVVQPNICVLENIQIDPDDLTAYIDKVGHDVFSLGLREVVNQWKDAEHYGSLIRPLLEDVNEVLELLRERQVGEDLFLARVHQKVLKALRQAHFLSPKYHVVVANPPYMGQKGMTDGMKTFAKKHFPKSKSDLYSMFIERLLDIGLSSSQLGLMTPFTWMFLSSHSDIRETLLHEATITTLVRPEYHAFFESAFVPVCAFTLISAPNPTQLGVFIDLDEFYGADQQAPRFLEAISDPTVPYRHTACPSDFDKIPGLPLAYWVSDRVRSVFEDNPQMRDRVDSKQGLATANNDRFMRRWWEVSLKNIGMGLTSSQEAIESTLRWFPINKGGPFRKWYGNHEFIVNWQNNGAEVRDYVNERYPYLKGNIDYVIKDRGKFFCESVSWSDVTAATNAFRYYPKGFLYDATGHSAFCNTKDDMYVLLSFANNVFCTSAAKILNPTMHFHIGYFDLLPWPSKHESDVVRPIVESLIQYSREDWNESELSWEFNSLSLIRTDVTLASAFLDKRNDERERISEVKRLERKNNEYFLSANGLSSEFDSEVPEDQITLNCNPRHRYEENKSESELEALFLADTIREFVSYAVGCMLGRYSLDKPGLILANQGETAEDYRQEIPERTFPPDEDNAIPLLDGDWFTDDITERFKEFLKVTFGTENYEVNLAFLENALYPENISGKKRKTIRDYFLKDFYNHHIKLYKKRPIYWLFSSPKGTFNALIYMHRYRPDTVSTVLGYLRDFILKLTANVEHLQSIADGTEGSKAEKAKALKQITGLKKDIKELNDYEHNVMFPLASQQIEIDLDDGVKVNYNKFGSALKKVTGLSGK